MDDRICLITGGNTGIGRATALELARQRFHLVLAGRSEERTAPVIEQIRAEGGRADFIPLDLASLDSVRSAAQTFRSMDLPLWVLVNNAGIVARRGRTTVDGFEPTFGVNHLGHFLLSRWLMPQLRAAAPSRLVNVASDAHYGAKSIDWEALQQPTASLTGFREYEVSKLANVLFSRALARRLAGTGVSTYALHPGTVATDLWRRMPWPIRPLMKMGMLTPEEGATTPVYCATAPELADQTGLYYANSRTKEPSRLARDDTLADELWERSGEWVAEYLPEEG